MQKIWTDARQWEEVLAGMWEPHPPDYYNEDRALEIMRSDLFGKAMENVIMEWKYSCLNSLTDETINRVAWLGQAAMAWSYNLPQHITRQLWGKLTPMERDKANGLAKKAIYKWEKRNNKTIQSISGCVEEPMLF